VQKSVRAPYPYPSAVPRWARRARATAPALATSWESGLFRAWRHYKIGNAVPKFVGGPPRVSQITKKSRPKVSNFRVLGRLYL
jgi:hypothetical protein